VRSAGRWWSGCASRDHDVRVLSRRQGAGTHVGDLVTGAGVAEAAGGADVIVHAATDAPTGRRDLAQTRTLLGAARGVRHLIYVSIVGIEALPLGYYKHKVQCEGAIAASGIAYTFQRATQFHELLALWLGRPPDVGGPGVLRLREIVAAWRERRGRPRAVVGVRLPGRVARAFREGRNTCPDRAVGHQTWAQYLAAR
jgi:hypothetical protein